MLLRSEGGSVTGGLEFVLAFELLLPFPPKNFPKPPIPPVIRERRPVGGGGGFLRILLPGMGIVTEEVDALRTGGGGWGGKEDGGMGEPGGIGEEDIVKSREKKLGQHLMSKSKREHT